MTSATIYESDITLRVRCVQFTVKSNHLAANRITCLDFFVMPTLGRRCLHLAQVGELDEYAEDGQLICRLFLRTTSYPLGLLLIYSKVHILSPGDHPCRISGIASYQCFDQWHMMG
uniref:C2 tensin-type domain-containing protein n=1 Tax=Steinernema glaseri TaxID=37863 RepID=A0A1I8A1U1_9BILA